MAYFVTGATGFIGRFLVANLLKRGEPVYVLVRKTSAKKLAALREYWGADEKQVIGVIGDLGKKNLGVADADLKKLKGKIKHFFHLAAIYDLAASAEDQQVANVEGTRHAVQFAEAVQAGCFHQVSSIAAAGLYDGVFREDMFEEAEELDHPYFRTKHDSEGIVRRECKRPWRIYRPSAVVGHSKTGFIDKIDGPTISSRRCRSCATSCRRGCRWSGSKAGASTSFPSISSPTRSTTSPISAASTGNASI